MSISDAYYTYPGVSYLVEPARRRIPAFAWEYLDSGTGIEQLVDENTNRLQQIKLIPRFLSGPGNDDLTTSFLGETHAAPFGIAPVGMTGLLWPDGEHMLARSAARQNIPYCLSSVACETPETVGEQVGTKGWFQLYVPLDRDVCVDLLNRAWKAGFKTLVVTIDVPSTSVRERQRKAGLRVPPVTDLRTIRQILARPAWAKAMLAHGKPRFKMLEKYVESDKMRDVVGYLGRQLTDCFDEDYIRFVRDHWKGKLILKGVLHEEDAVMALNCGVDAIVVSNHGGRQFDAAPAAIDALAPLVKTIDGKCGVLFDSGIRGGLDILRALALGADFVLLGRAFIYAIAVLGSEGGDYLVRILKEDIANNMQQLGAKSFDELPDLLMVE